MGKSKGDGEVRPQHLDVQREAYFPNLRRDQYRITSDETPNYNCIAHAAGADNRPWWPVDAVGVYWPEGVNRAETLEAFVSAYGRQGYAPCDSADHEDGFEKVALYVDGSGEPVHAARQLRDGKWTSKLGDWEDIEHETLAVLEDDHLAQGRGYGKVAQILRRAAAKPDPRQSA
jgi:hypothetical protein